MKKAQYLIILAALSILFFASEALGEELTTHSAYRVTSYNLGAVLEVTDEASPYIKKDFKPLLITSSATDILNSEHGGSVSWVETESHTSSTSGIAVSAEFDATSKLSVQTAFGLTRNLWAPDSLEYENESSWEANLGLIYKLVDNLSYELHFGYMDTGDLFTDKSSYSDVESIIMVSNRLTMSF